LQEITAICGVFITKDGGFSIGGQALGTGVSIGKTSNKTIRIGDLTNHHLRQYFSLLVQKARKQKNVVGATFHFNNLELLAQKGPHQLRTLFEKVRDVLQEPNVYFVFVGYRGMFQQVIVQSERVRSIFFDTPLWSRNPAKANRRSTSIFKCLSVTTISIYLRQSDGIASTKSTQGSPFLLRQEASTKPEKLK
jgi:hypothetical protein